MSIDSFHKNPAHQRNVLNNPVNFPVMTEIEFGGLILDLNVNRITDLSGNTTGYVVNWEEITESKKNEEEVIKIQQMVDMAPVNIMMADLKGNITYLNNTSITTLRSIQHLLPVKVDQILGNSFDVFHKNPSHQQNLIKNPTNFPYQAEIKLGEEFLDLNVVGVYDKQGDYIGPMVTWEVVTAKKILVDELTQSANHLSASGEELLTLSSTMAWPMLKKLQHNPIPQERHQRKYQQEFNLSQHQWRKCPPLLRRLPNQLMNHQSVQTRP